MSTVAFATTTLAAAVLVSHFCICRATLSDEDDAESIERLNARISDISKKQPERSFERFDMRVSALAGSRAAHASSENRIRKNRAETRIWRFDIHGVAALGATLCICSVAAAVLLWKHLWPVDRCRQVLRGRGIASASAPAQWRFASPCLLLLFGLALCIWPLFVQLRTNNRTVVQRNIFSLAGAVFLLFISLFAQFISASFARDASAVVAWAHSRGNKLNRVSGNSVCASVVGDIQRRSIKP